MVREFLRADNERKPCWRQFCERSLQELIAISLPVMGIATVLAVGACFLYDPDMKALLYSTLPEMYKNWFSFGVCWLEELRTLLMYVGIAGPLIQIQVIAFDLLNDSLEAIGKDVRGYETMGL